VTGATTPIGVFLLDDHEIVRRGLCDLIDSEPDLSVVGEAGSVAEALNRIPLSSPRVAVLDVQLGDGTGIEVCRDIRSSHPEIACLMLTSYADDEALMDSVVAGASGYVLKQVRGNDLLDGIRRVAAGQSLLDPAVTARVIERLRRGPEEDARLSTLTPREGEILGLLADGLTNRQIGETLNLAEKTVKNNVSNVLMKLGMERRTQAAVYAARHADRRASRAG
jgi:two-component system response regulator DevR